MNQIGGRIKELLKDKNMTIAELCDKTNVSKAQMNRYVNHGAQPQSDTLNKISSILSTSVDYLLNGKTDDKAKEILKNVELLNQFKAIEAMPDKDRNIVSELINAFIAKRQLQKLILT